MRRLRWRDGEMGSGGVKREARQEIKEMVSQMMAKGWSGA
jgi:hypothetical protein